MNAITSSIIGEAMLSRGQSGTFFAAMSLRIIKNIAALLGPDDAWWTNITEVAMICIFLMV